MWSIRFSTVNNSLVTLVVLCTVSDIITLHYITLDLVCNLGLGSSLPRNTPFKTNICWGLWDRRASKKLWPRFISAFVEASDFKFSTLHEFGFTLLKATFETKRGGGIKGTAKEHTLKPGKNVGPLLLKPLKLMLKYDRMQGINGQVQGVDRRPACDRTLSVDAVNTCIWSYAGCIRS